MKIAPASLGVNWMMHFISTSSSCLHDQFHLIKTNDEALQVIQNCQHYQNLNNEN